MYQSSNTQHQLELEQMEEQAHFLLRKYPQHSFSEEEWLDTHTVAGVSFFIFMRGHRLDYYLR